MYNYKQLKNKLHLYTVPNSNTNAVTVMVMLPAGSRYETDNLRGASHFIEHMMFKGTEKRPSTLDITTEVDRYGADYNAFTGKEYTGYYIKIDRQYLETALDILSDVIINSKFEEEEMKKEKDVISEEIKMYNDNPRMNIGNIFEELMYEGCNLEYDIAGTEETVLGLDREEVLDYKNKFYQPKNISVVVAGASDNDVESLVENNFTFENNSEEIEDVGTATLGSERIKVQTKDTDQAQLMLGFPSYGYGNKDNSALSVLNKIIGGSMSSKLFTRIREKMGLAYSIRSGLSKYKDTGQFYIRAGLDPDNINKAIDEIKNILSEIKAEGVTDKELSDAKTNLQGSATLNMEDSSNKASWVAKRSIYDEKNNIKTVEDKLDEVKGVSSKDIKRVANDIFNLGQMRAAVIGNIDKEDIEL